eukprot:PLAT11000.1.p1 GENE.PLAT11000.1~~PLAT11000.1.p1  ORF type:complete len:1210 (+),score=730.48 PLAT11000.1:90-3719(+)
MKRCLPLLLLLALSAPLLVAADDVSLLQALENRVLSGDTAVFNSTTLADDSLAPFLQALIGDIELLAAHCSIAPKATPAYLSCSGSTTVLNGAAADGNIVIAVLRTSSSANSMSFMGALTVNLGKSWQPSSAISSLPSDSWLHGLSYEQLGGNATLASAAFPAAERTFVKGLSLELADVSIASGSTLLGLTSLLPSAASLSFDVKAHVPVLSSALHTEGATVNCLLNADLPLANGGGNSVDKVTASMTGLGSSPAVTVNANTVLSLKNNASPVTFAATGSWSAASQSLNLAGGMVGDWPQPYGVQWLTINAAHVAAVISTASPPSLTSLTFNGGATMTTAAGGSYTGSFNGATSDNYADSQLTLALDAVLPAGEAVTTWLGMPAGTHSLLGDVTLLSDVSKLVLSTYAFNGNVRGLSFYSTAQLNDGSATAALLSGLGGGLTPQTQLALTVQLTDGGSGLPVGNLSDALVQLTADSVPLSSALTLKNVVLKMDARPAVDTTVTAATDINTAFAHQPPLTFSTQAVWDSAAKDITWNGAMTSSWAQPFGVSWLTVQSAQANFVIAYGAPAGQSNGLQSLKIDAQSTLSFAKLPSASMPLTFTALNNFAEIGLQGDIDVDIDTGLGDALRKLLGNSLANTLDDIQVQSGKLTVTLTSFDWAAPVGAQTFQPGVTLDADVIVSGPTMARVKPLLLGASTTHDFHFQFYLPMFGGAVAEQQDAVAAAGPSFTLHTPTVPINGHMNFTGLQLELSVSTPASVSVSTGVACAFKSQPAPITFVLGGQLAADGQYSLEGGMDGTWDNLFNIHDLDVGNVWAKVSFGATGLTGVGAGGKLTMGEIIFDLNGYVDIESVDEIFFQASVNELSLKDLAESYNDMVPASWPHIDVHLVPNIFDFKNVQLSLAPADGQIDIDGEQVTFERGITILGEYKILFIHGHVHIHTDFGGLAAAPRLRGAAPLAGAADGTLSPNLLVDFNFVQNSTLNNYVAYTSSVLPHRQFQPPTLFTMSPAEVQDFQGTVAKQMPSVTSVNVTGFNMAALAAGTKPNIVLGLLYKGQAYTHTQPLELNSFSSSLGDLLGNGTIDLRPTLGNPACIVNAHCGEGLSCSHSESAPPQCVSSCASTAGVASEFGCVTCMSSAECTASSSGSCCSNGACVGAIGSSDVCGMCLPEMEASCNSVGAGCFNGFCVQCSSDAECFWNGAAGSMCIDGSCQ